MRRTVLTVLSFLLIGLPLIGETPQLKTTLLWHAGENGYETYRIPGIVVTSRGTVLAYGVARRRLKDGDWGDIDIVLRRSTDSGDHWDASRRIAGNSNGVTDNPVAIASRHRGVVHFLYQHDYAHIFYMKSTDDGAHFSKPVDITSSMTDLRPGYNWNVVATGPGHGIELKNGRLLVPVWMALGKVEASGHRSHGPSAITTLYSDDQGKTWKHGDIIATDSPEMRSPNEMELVQLADGSVMANIRTKDGTLQRAVAVSPDGVSHWSKPKFDPNLYDPHCMAGIARYDSHRILFTNPDSFSMPRRKNGEGQRENLTVRMSGDEGKSWPVSRLLVPGTTGYSDIAVDRNKDIFVIYEKADDSRNKALSLYVARFRLQWLMQK